MTLISKNLSIDKLDDIVNKYNTYHNTIKMKPVDVKSSTYIGSSKEINDKDPKFKVGDTVRISLCHEHMLLVILKAKRLLERFMKKNCKKQIKKSLELKK